MSQEYSVILLFILSKEAFVVETKRIKPTDKNLRLFGVRLLMRWLIVAAKKKTTLTYGEVKDRLERECHFTSMGASGARRIGPVVAESMQTEIHKHEGSAPLLNTLVVTKNDRLPGKGECIREIFYDHFPDEVWLKSEGALKRHPEKWRKVVWRATQEVYNYQHWETLYEKIYGEKLQHQ